MAKCRSDTNRLLSLEFTISPNVVFPGHAETSASGGGGHLGKSGDKDDQDEKKKNFFFDLRQSSQVVSDMLGEVTAGVAAEKNFLVLTTSETDLG